jgi:hypothetical protein
MQSSACVVTHMFFRTLDLDKRVKESYIRLRNICNWTVCQMFTRNVQVGNICKYITITGSYENSFQCQIFFSERSYLSTSM